MGRWGSRARTISPRLYRLALASRRNMEQGNPRQVLPTLNPQSREPSLAGLKRSIARGEYAMDPGVLAEAIVWKLGVVRKVRSQLTADDADSDDRGGAQTPRRRERGRSRPGSRPPIRPRPGHTG